MTDVLVVGSGLAGLSCALELSLRGRRVLVVERAGHLGGRTASWYQDGMCVESALHRVPGFYSAFPRFLRKAGLRVRDVLIWTDAIEIRTPNGARAFYRTAPAHHPLNTTGTVLGNNAFLGAHEKAVIARLMAAGLRDYFVRPHELDQIDIVSYATKRGVDETVLQRYIEPLSTGLLFLEPQRYSAYVFFASVGAFLARTVKMRMGNFRAPMGECMIAPVAGKIAELGGQFKTGMEVEKILIEDGHARGVTVAGLPLYASDVVLATPLIDAKRILRASLEDHGGFEDLFALETMSAMSIQFELSAPCLPGDHPMFGPGTSLSSFSEQGRTTFSHLPGHLSVILAPPEKFLNMPAHEIAEIVYRDAERLGFTVRDKVVRYRVVAERDQFHAVSLGMQALRPAQRTPVPHLYLAGDYTRQKYPPTMEAAVVSGRLAADAVTAPSV